MNTKMPIKIAVVIPKYGLVGGGEKFVVELTERIAQRSSYEMHILANRWKDQSPIMRFHKIPIISFPKYLTTISFARFVEQKIKKIGFDLIHSHERIFAADIVSLHSIPHRLWVQDIRRKRFFSLFDRATIWVEKRMVHNTSSTIFLPVSNIAREKFIAEYPFVSDHVETLHPGVDMTRINQLDRSQCRKNIRTQFGFHESDTVLLFVGMNFELKGLDQVISAMAIIKTTHQEPRLKLLIVGKGNVNKYQKMAQHAGVGGDVRFTGVIKDKMEEMYLSADIYAMLSTFDTFGMTVLEAMAASLPVIISRNVGAKDLIREGVNGFIVDREDIDAISRRILLLLDKEKRTSMGLEAHKVAQNHTWDIMTNKVLELYKNILSSKEDGH
jgi:UDP-glucose:(heptosyl)LPS alpha-1,3-glucosyltransferase